MDAELKTRQPAHSPENAVGPVAVLDGNAMLLHECSQQCCVALLFTDEQLDDAHQGRGSMQLREPLGGSQQSAALGLLPELKGGDGVGDQPPLVSFENRRQPVGNAARMLGVIFEMVQPDPQIGEHAKPSRFSSMA